MAELPAPSNPWVDLINSVIDALVMGLGVDAAIASATAQAPFLAWPIVSQVFRFIVKSLAQVIDTNGKRFADILVVRFQNDLLKAAYDDALKPLKDKDASDVTPEELQKAKDAIDRLVSRARYF